MKFENVSNKLTKEEMNVLKGGITSGGNRCIVGDTFLPKPNIWVTDWKDDSGGAA